ncbi:MAG: carbon-nitrogen hydrolase family protein [Planctomycetales bacterium]|nr:carbon-nitrogen hydrolase family protein [Planctomycetales bacterium]
MNKLLFLAAIIAAQLTAGALAAAGETLTVATAQLPVSRDVAENAATIDRAIDTAIAAEADILLTPEGSLSGYTHEFDQSAVDAALVPLLAKAKSAGLALALGTCFVEPDDGKCYNEIRFYDADGNYLGAHCKILRCGSMTTPSKGEINHYATRPLTTFQIKGITVGGLICNDMWANPGCTPMPDPHLSQQLSEAGARVVFHAINGGRDGGEMSKNVYWHFHESNQRIRAITGKLWIVAADNCAPTTIPCSAPSGVLGPDGRWAAQAAPQGEEVVVYTINLD